MWSCDQYMPILNSPIPDPDLLFYHDNPMTAGPTKKQFERLLEGKYNHDPPPPKERWAQIKQPAPEKLQNRPTTTRTLTQARLLHYITSTQPAGHCYPITNICHSKLGPLGRRKGT